MSKVVEWLVLVDEDDNELGVETREKCHIGNGLRHRAFVVFLFQGKRLLLQRRSSKKLLWPGFWDVSVTSHVYRGESYESASIRRTREELSCDVNNLRRVLSFTYWAPFGDFSENEYCVLLLGDLDGKVSPNPEEIMEIKFATIDQLEEELEQEGERYTPWLKLAFGRFLRHKASQKYR